LVDDLIALCVRSSASQSGVKRALESGTVLTSRPYHMPGQSLMSTLNEQFS